MLIVSRDNVVGFLFRMLLTLLIATMMTVMMTTILDPDLGAGPIFRLLRRLNNVEDLSLLRSNPSPMIGHSRCTSIIQWLLYIMWHFLIVKSLTSERSVLSTAPIGDHLLLGEV